MAKKRASKKFKKDTGKLKRLIRYLEKGDKLVIKGARGKPVKTVVTGRKYILEVKRKNKLIGYINNTKTVNKQKVPNPQEFSRSMISRLKNTYQVPIVQARVAGQEKVKLVSTRRVTSQITSKSRLIRELKENSGKAFNLKLVGDIPDAQGKPIQVESDRIYYKNDEMTDEELKKLILSNFFNMLGTSKLRISDRLNKDGKIINENRKLIETGTLQMEFSEVDL